MDGHEEETSPFILFNIILIFESCGFIVCSKNKIEKELEFLEIKHITIF